MARGTGSSASTQGRRGVANDTHTTDGERYRIPSHPRVIAALGRVAYNFLTVEETAAEIISDAGMMDLSEARSLLAGRKVRRLNRLRDAVRALSEAPPDLVEILDRAHKAFKTVTENYRNPILHAGFYTAGTDAKGNYLPGIGTLDAEGHQRDLETPEQVHEVAHHIEDAIDPLRDAHEAVGQHRDLIARALSAQS